MEEISPIKDRILTFLDETGIKKAQFYKETGISDANFKGIGLKSELGGDKIVKILTIYQNLSADWLLTGQGDMLKTNGTTDNVPTVYEIPDSRKGKYKFSTDQENSDISSRKNARTLKKADVPGEGIPLIPISAMAGILSGEVTVLDYECERYIVPAFKGADFLIPVKGSSMAPTYVSGDIVACQRVPMTSIFFQWNKPYVIDTNQGAIIKRIKPGSDAEHVRIVSDNPQYDPFELHLSDIHAVALVIGIIRLE